MKKNTEAKPAKKAQPRVERGEKSSSENASDKSPGPGGSRQGNIGHQRESNGDNKATDFVVSALHS